MRRHILTLLLSATLASAEARYALVIGNDAYMNVPKLHNAVGDSRLVANALRDAGFQVTAVENATREQMDSTVTLWINRIPSGAAALVYYAGHGVEIDGVNYLLPVDLVASDAVQARNRSMSAQELLDRVVARDASVQVLVLDACRNNPFPGRDIGGRGLAPMAAASGSFIAFSTSPSTIASDGSVYAQRLAAAIGAPGLSIEQVFKRVSAEVQQATAKRQVPWVTSSLAGDFYFLDAAAERARLEQELLSLQRQTEDAARRKAEQERQEKERQTALLRARIEAIPAPVAPNNSAEDERLRLGELRRKRDEQQALLSSVSTMTLEQAKKEVQDLEQQIATLQKDYDVARDEAIKHLPPELAEKSMFETTAAFNLRRQKADEAKSDINKRYSDQFESAVVASRKRISDLKSRTYLLENAKLEFVAYDADSQILRARINGEEHRFRVPAPAAEAIYQNTSASWVEQTFTNSLLALTSGGVKYFSLASPSSGWTRFR